MGTTTRPMGVCYSCSKTDKEKAAAKARQTAEALSQWIGTPYDAKWMQMLGRAPLAAVEDAARCMSEAAKELKEMDAAERLWDCRMQALQRRLANPPCDTDTVRVDVKLPDGSRMALSNVTRNLPAEEVCARIVVAAGEKLSVWTRPADCTILIGTCPVGASLAAAGVEDGAVLVMLVNEERVKQRESREQEMDEEWRAWEATVEMGQRRLDEARSAKQKEEEEETRKFWNTAHIDLEVTPCGRRDDAQQHNLITIA